MGWQHLEAAADQVGTLS